MVSMQDVAEVDPVSQMCHHGDARRVASDEEIEESFVGFWRIVNLHRCGLAVLKVLQFQGFINTLLGP